MKKLVLVLAISLVIFQPAQAQTFVESVLKDGIGVRPIGMGGAFTAVANDSNAIFYNPGGLGFVDFSYTLGYQDIQNTKLNNYYLVAYKLVGLGNWRREDNSGNIAEVTIFSIGSIGSNMLGWGFSTKRIDGIIAGSVVDGTSMDIGMKGPITNNIHFGLVAQDIFKNNLNVPTSIRAGIAGEAAIDGMFAIDAELTNLKSSRGMDIYMHYGFEKYMTDGLILRIGWQKDKYTGGATATFKYFTADFAATTHPYNGTTTYMMSFRMGKGA